MKKALIFIFLLLVLIQPLYAVSPVEFLKLAVKDEDAMNATARKGLLLTGIPLLAGGTMIQDPSTKSVVMIIGGLSVAMGLFEDSLPMAHDLRTKYELQKDNMNDKTAIKILKDERNKFEFARKIRAGALLIASLFNYGNPNCPSNYNDLNVTIKSVLIGSAINLWFNPSIEERMLDSAIKGEATFEAL